MRDNRTMHLRSEVRFSLRSSVFSLRRSAFKALTRPNLLSTPAELQRN